MSFNEVYTDEGIKKVIGEELEKHKEVLADKAKCNAEQITFSSYLLKQAYSIEVAISAGDKDLLGFFCLSEMPGCCGVMISHHAAVEKEYRNRGVGQVLMKLREDIAKNLGYSLMMCTTRHNNKAQRRVLQNNDWERDQYFPNNRTNNLVEVWTKRIL